MTTAEPPPITAAERRRIRRRMDRDRVERLLGDLMPYAQKLLVDWSWDLVADDGTAYRHAWTRKNPS